MASSSQAAVTPAGIRDGDPAALAALVERRANAVLAYCEAVFGPPEAERAAAEAFARFRAAVAAAEDPQSLDPEALLLDATRHAAASLTVPAEPPPAPAAAGLRRRFAGPARSADAPDVCTLVPGLLAARAEDVLGTADIERLARHLERHPACRQLAVAVNLAENRYTFPPDRTVPIGALTEIMLALTNAAPITAAPATNLDFAAIEPEGSTAARDEPELEATALVPGPPVPAPEPQTTAFVPAPPVPAPETAPSPRPQPRTTSGPLLPPTPPYPTEVRAVLSAEPVTAASPAVPAADEPRDFVNHTLVRTPVPAGQTMSGTAHPRRPRDATPATSEDGDHGVMLRFVLPGVLVAAALLAAMGVAGVFAADRPVPAPPPVGSTAVPSAPPAGAPPVAPETDVEAEERAALAAERRARREREAAKRRREREAARATPTTTSDPDPPPAAATPAPEPAPAPTPKPTPPASQGTVEKKPPADSASGLPETDTDPTPPADPGVFQEAPPPAP